jgi:hypothetical protein
MVLEGENYDFVTLRTELEEQTSASFHGTCSERNVCIKIFIHLNMYESLLCTCARCRVLVFRHSAE